MPLAGRCDRLWQGYCAGKDLSQLNPRTLSSFLERLSKVRDFRQVETARENAAAAARLPPTDELGRFTQVGARSAASRDDDQKQEQKRQRAANGLLKSVANVVNVYTTSGRAIRLVLALADSTGRGVSTDLEDGPEGEPPKRFLRSNGFLSSAPFTQLQQAVADELPNHGASYQIQVLLQRSFLGAHGTEGELCCIKGPR